MSQRNLLPNYPIPLEVGEHTSKDWYFFWAGLYNGLPPATEVAVTPGASPYTYSAPVRGNLIVSGVGVTAIAFSRDGVTFYATGVTAGMFLLSAADQMRVTYAGAAVLTFVPV